MTGETWISFRLNTAALAKGRGARRNQVHDMINQPLGGRLDICFFNIRGVPSFFFFKEGQLVDQISGAVSADVLNQKLRALDLLP